MSMKDLLNKMTELQGATKEEKVTTTGKRVLNESAERPYVCVHAKKGKCEVKANSSYEAAKKAADKWKLKSTAGIDAHVADKLISTASLEENTKPSLKSMFNALLAEAEQVTIQPAKQNTQVIKQGDKTLGTVENPQLAQQIKQSIGKGEMNLAGDELQEDDLDEAKVKDFRENEIRALSKAFFGYKPYSSARIDNGKILRLSFNLPEMNKYRYVSLDSIDPEDKQALKDIKTDFLQYMAKKGVSSEEVDMKFHIGAGIYASVRITIPQNAGDDLQKDVMESKLNEKAVSKSQQQAAGIALAAKRGEMPKSKLKGASKEMEKMSAKELEKFAKTKHKGLPDKKEKTNEAAMPTNDSDFGAGLGAGRNSKTLEAKKAKPDFLDLDKDGNKKESMKKAAADKQKVSTMKKTNEAKAKPDFLDLDKDGNKKEPMKKAAADKKTGSTDKKSSAGLTAAQKKLPAGLQKAVAKKKTVKEGTNPTESARLLGKAHAMANDTFSCKYEEGSQEAQAYLDGYKSGLDECYGSGGGMGMQQDIGMMPGMDSMVSQDSMMDTPSPRGGSEFAFGGFDDVSDDDMMAFESWDRELNALLNETVTPKFQVRYLPNNRDTYKIEKGFASKKEAQDWIKGENLRDRAEDISIETSTSKEVNEGKIKDIDIDMTHMTDTKFKEKYGKSKADMKKDLSGSTDKKPVKEGISVSVSKGQQGEPDSVTVSAQDSEADQLLSLIKQAGLGLFGGEETSGYGSPVSVATQPIGDVGDHDSMMNLIKKMSSTGNDYEDEESQDDQHVHGHPDAACDNCGSATCEGESCSSSSKETMMGEDETEDQMEFEVAESNAPDSDEAETTADENAEAKEDQALAGADSSNEEEINEDSSYPTINGKQVDVRSIEIEGGTVDDTADTYVTYAEFTDGSPLSDRELDELSDDNYLMSELKMNMYEGLNEWANDAGYEGSENIKDNTFEQDIEFMMNVISGGLNGQKQDQTTLPHTKVKVAESSLLDDWKKLSGIR